MQFQWPLGLSLAFALTPYSNAATLAVPNSNPNYPVATQADGPYHDGEMTRVILMNENQLVPLLGRTITGVAFKVHALQSTTWPSTTANYIKCDLYLGPCVHPGAKSTTFLSNYIGTRTQVRSGSISVGANTIPTGNNFFPFIAITPYVYSGGHLMLEHRRGGFFGSYAWITGVRTSDPEYNDTISAVRAGTDTSVTGVQHAAPVTLFQYEEPTMTLSGTINLQNFIGTPGSVPIQVQILPVGGSTPIHTAMVTGGAFSIGLPPAVTPGTYDIAFNGSPFLRRKLTMPLAAGTNGTTADLRNGDVDDSAEVDAADIDAAIAAFGNTGNVVGDADGSLEVDAADIDVIISSFGEVDE
ncbi:MAG: hypothetical protein JNK63_00085 [Chthonomonas sp.]|nr:hypothetical protein [Chthonomonas sp.]